MWARHFEIALGLWLVTSPFVFAADGSRALWIHDFTCGAALIVVPLLCYRHAWRRAHLVLLALAAWLAGYGWVLAFGGDPTPASQNHLVVGLLVAMLAIVPSRAATPPDSWLERTA